MPQRSVTCTITRGKGSLLGMSVGVCVVIWQAFGLGLAAATTCCSFCTRPALASSLFSSGRKPGLPASKLRTCASRASSCGRCAASARRSTSCARMSSISLPISSMGAVNHQCSSTR
jgi:hypothetical protein